MKTWKAGLFNNYQNISRKFNVFFLDLYSAFTCLDDFYSTLCLKLLHCYNVRALYSVSDFL